MKYRAEYESNFTLGGKAYKAIVKPSMTCTGCAFKDDISGCFKAPSCVPTAALTGAEGVRVEGTVMQQTGD